MPEHHHTMQQLRAAKARARDRWSDVDGVQGVGIGDGCVRLYVRSPDVLDPRPTDVDGITVELVTVGEVTTRDR